MRVAKKGKMYLPNPNPTSPSFDSLTVRLTGKSQQNPTTATLITQLDGRQMQNSIQYPLFERKKCLFKVYLCHCAKNMEYGWVYFSELPLNLPTNSCKLPNCNTYSIQ